MYFVQRISCIRSHVCIVLTIDTYVDILPKYDDQTLLDFKNIGANAQKAIIKNTVHHSIKTRKTRTTKEPRLTASNSNTATTTTTIRHDVQWRRSEQKQQH
jgi:hypothetical protein